MDRYTGGAATVAAVVGFFVFSSVSAQAQGMAGATPAQASTSQTGAFQYRIPISVPPGIGGITPKLELSYSSQSSGSLLGKGWNLGGLSSISRCPRTKAGDGVMGGVNFDANDRFCLDGQRLIVVSGTYGAANSEYRTERESFSKVTFDGNAFTVKTKDGLIQQYGGTDKSSVEAQGKTAIRTWALNKLSDRLGNYLSVSYEEENANGDYRPTRIDYTANASRAADSYVVFDYGDRKDITPRYLAGSVIKTMKRLVKISTFTGGSQVKEYRLAYADQPTTQDKSQLTSITECDGPAPAGLCLPAHTIQWGAAGTSGFASPVNKLAAFGSSAGGWSDSVTFPRLFADVNGDGLVDIVGFAADGVYVSSNTGSGYAAPTRWLAAFGTTAGGWTNNNDMPRHLVDVDGDGLPDIVGFGSDGVWVALNTGSGFATQTKWLAAFGTAAGGWINNNDMPRHVMDVNGDGLPDIVGFGAGGVVAALNTGGGFVLPTYTCASGNTVSGFSCLNIYTASPICPSTGDSEAWSLNESPERSCSYFQNNHDGGDFHYAIPIGYSCPSGGTLKGSACTNIVQVQASFTCPANYVVSGTTCVSILTNQPATWQTMKFGLQQGWTDSEITPRQLIDVNGDGLPDIVGFGPSGVMVAYNNGNGFNGPQNLLAEFGTTAGGWTDTKTMPRYLVDVNGDGLPDIVGFSATGVKVALNTGSGFTPSTQWIADFGTSAGGWTNFDTFPRKLVDVNGDALPDIVGFASTGLMVALNTGTAFDPAVNWVAAFGTTAGGWSSNTTTPREVLDMDGDGMPDVVGFAPGGVTVASNSRKAQASFVSSISNGLGLTYTPNYATLTAPANAGLYTKDSGANKAAFPWQDLAGPWYVLASLDSSNGLGDVNTTRYSYGGLKAEIGTGRGMLGFRWMSSKDTVTSLEKYTEFRQDWPYTGMIVKAETRLSGAGNGGVLQRTSATVACKIPLNGTACVIQSRCDQMANASACAAAASNRYFPYTDSVVDERWDINGASYPTTTTSTSYGVDSVNGQFYGDVASTTVSTSDGASRTAANVYYPTDVTNWILGRVQTVTTTLVKP